MKAQFLSFDAIFAIVIFIFAITILSFVWYTTNSQYSLIASGTTQNIQMQLEQLSERLLGPGSPSNWYGGILTNFSSLSPSGTPSWWGNISIGLGTGSPGNLSMQKIATLSSMANNNYQATKSLLGVGYDYYILIRGNGFLIQIGSKPKPFNNILTVETSAKGVVLNGQPAQMQMYIWTNSSFGIG